MNAAIAGGRNGAASRRARLQAAATAGLIPTRPFPSQAPFQRQAPFPGQRPFPANALMIQDRRRALLPSRAPRPNVDGIDARPCGARRVGVISEIGAVSATLPARWASAGPLCDRLR